MIKAIIFDWGGVYIDEPMEGLVKYCSKRLGVHKQEFIRIFKDYEKQLKTGTVTENHFWEQVCADLDVPVVQGLWREAVEEVFTVKEKTLRLIKALSEEYIVALLTNTEQPSIEYLYEKGLDKPFDLIIASSEEGCIKPEPKIYERALEKLKLKPDETIFIDDNPEFVKGAQKLGIQSIQYHNHEQLVQELNKLGVTVLEE